MRDVSRKLNIAINRNCRMYNTIYLQVYNLINSILNNDRVSRFRYKMFTDIIIRLQRVRDQITRNRTEIKLRFLNCFIRV